MWLSFFVSAKSWKKQNHTPAESKNVLLFLHYSLQMLSHAGRNVNKKAYWP